MGLGGMDSAMQKARQLEQMRTNTYQTAEELIERLTHYEKRDEEGRPVAKLEHRDDAETQKQAQELGDFLASHFGEAEGMDVGQIELSIRHGLMDWYVVHDAHGGIASVLGSSNLSLPAEAGPKGLALTGWYALSSEEERGKGDVFALFRSALQNALAEARERKLPLECIAVEGGQDIGRALERFDIDRLYSEEADGTLIEVPYRSAPQDDSTDGVPFHLLVRYLTGQRTIPARRLTALVQAMHDASLRPEYFTSEEEREYYPTYRAIIEGLERSFAEEMVNVTSVFPLSSREKRIRAREGTTIRDND